MESDELGAQPRVADGKFVGYLLNGAGGLGVNGWVWV